MWLLGLILIALSAFLFANAKWVDSKSNIQSSDIFFAKIPALFFLGAGAYLNNQYWAVESGVSLTVASFCFCMFTAVYFKLSVTKQNQTNTHKEAA